MTELVQLRYDLRTAAASLRVWQRADIKMEGGLVKLTVTCDEQNMLLVVGLLVTRHDIPAISYRFPREIICFDQRYGVCF